MTTTITVYRADERAYRPGEIITGNREDHIATMQGGHLLAEQLVRAAHPNGADLRAHYLYVFRDCEWARKYWVLRGPRHFYEAAVHPDDVLHIGDMNIFNQIADAETDQQRDEFIRQYWASAESRDNTKIELIVRRATVLRVLHTPDDQVAARRRLVGGGAKEG